MAKTGMFILHFSSNTKVFDHTYEGFITDELRTSCAFAAQNTLQNDGKSASVLKPEAPFGRRKKLPAAGSAVKVSTNKRLMKNENS